MNWECPQGELDIVAFEAGTLVFLEVKRRSRADHGRPAEFINARKQARLLRAAAMFAVAEGMTDRAMRFDVVEVIPNERGGWRCALIRDAFQPGGDYLPL